MLLLSKVSSALVVRNSEGVGDDDLSSVGSLSKKSTDHPCLRGIRSTSIVVKDGEEREGLEGNVSRSSAVRYAIFFFEKQRQEIRTR